MSDSEEIRINDILMPKTKLKDLIRMVWHNTANKDKDLGAAAKSKSLELPKPRATGPKKPRKPKARQIPLHFGKTDDKSNKQLTLPFEPPKEEKPEPKHKPITTEQEPKVEKPQVLSTLFSKKLDMSKPPFYQDADKWYKDNFKREDSQGYTYSVRYIGPTLWDLMFKFSSYPHENNVESYNRFYDDREKNMHFWNQLMKKYVKKKWPNEFAGMNEQFKLQK